MPTTRTTTSTHVPMTATTGALTTTTAPATKSTTKKRLATTTTLDEFQQLKQIQDAHDLQQEEEQHQNIVQLVQQQFWEHLELSNQ
ncbi:unnamed protein product [Rotaria sp. Silwood2]|nr:unnamed protein product [Rotaria sp. Silwood2]CAF3293420.1 unnamed protein product [Rotaria sp. Silwood2]CAF4159790.1 unnamed protein product [Rotaria sp. Silwood2]